MSDTPDRMGTLHFNLDTPGGRMAMARALAADNAYQALSEVREQLFRPARKHGYGRQEIANALEIANKETDGAGTLLVALLEDLYTNILRDLSIDMENTWV